MCIFQNFHSPGNRTRLKLLFVNLLLSLCLVRCVDSISSFTLQSKQFTLKIHNMVVLSVNTCQLHTVRIKNREYSLCYTSCDFDLSQITWTWYFQALCCHVLLIDVKIWISSCEITREVVGPLLNCVNTARPVNQPLSPYAQTCSSIKGSHDR